MASEYNQLDNFFTGSPKERDRKPSYFPSKEQFYYLPSVLSPKERYMLTALALIALGAFMATPISIYRHGTTAVAATGGSWTEGMVGTPQHINPLLLQANDVDSDLANLLYAGLLRYDSQGNLVPELAESYTISDDGLQYTFKLKDGLRWHDGQSLTVDDVVFTIITAQNSDYASTQRINWQGVDVSKNGDRTVVFKLKNRYAQFINNTTIGILPKHIWENVKGSNFALSDNNLKPIGAGPYQFSKIKRDASGTIKSLELIAFEKYAGNSPYIDKITFTFYDSEQASINGYNNGDVNGLSFISAEKLDTLHGGQFQVQHLHLPRYFAVFLNQNRSKALSDKQVRLALNYATDKQAMVNNVLKGNGTMVNSPLLPGIINVPDDVVKYSFDVEKAKSLLDSAGWKPGSDRIRSKDIKTNGKTETVPLEIEITTSSWPELLAVANTIKSQWERIGARVTIKSLSVPEVQQAIKERDYTALLFGEVLGLDPDPFSFWHSSQKHDPGLNLALYDSKDADKFLEDARQTLDPAARKAKYDQLQKIIVGDAPVVFLYSPDYLYIQPKNIKGNQAQIIAVPANRFDTVQEWYIDTQRKKK